MAQNTTFNQVITLIQGAYQEAMLIEEGQEPNSEQIASALVRLNMMINHLQTQGIRLWTQVDFSITLLAGQSLYPINMAYGKPLRIPKDLSYLLNTASLGKVPVTTLSQQEWVLLNQGSSQGIVSQIYVDKQISFLNVNTYLTPDASTASTYNLHVVYQAQMVPGMQITDTTMLPLEWYQTLRWMLAQQICIGQPQAVTARIDAMAAKYQADLDGWDVEDAQVFFTPDVRMSTNYSRFR